MWSARSPIHEGELCATDTTFRWGTTVDRRSDFSTARRHLGCAGIHTVEDGQAYGGSAQSMNKLEDLLPHRRRSTPSASPSVGVNPVAILVGVVLVGIVIGVAWLLAKRKKSAT